MKTLNLFIGIIAVSMILFSCSMGTVSDARIANVQVENPAHIKIADVKPGDTFYISVEVRGKIETLSTTEPVMVDVSTITGNAPGTDMCIMNDEGIYGDKEADDSIYTCAYTLPYGNEEGIDGGVYDLNVIVKNIYDAIICEETYQLNIHSLPPVLEYARIDNKTYINIIHRTESDEISVDFKAKVSSYNGHSEGHNGFDINAGGYVKVEIPPELNDGVVGTAYLFDDGTEYDDVAWDCVFNGSFTLKPTFAPEAFEVTFYVRNNAGVEVSESLEVNVKSDFTYVSPTAGSDETGNGSVNLPFQTIQKGIDESVYGLKLLQGVYTGDGNRDLNFNGKEITVESVSGAKYTIIDCQGSDNNPHRAFIFESRETDLTQVKDITIRNGFGQEEIQFADGYSVGGAIICTNFSSPKFENLIITSNKADLGSAVACFNTSMPTFISCEFTKNKSQNDSEDCGGTISLYNDSDAKFENCLIAGNSVENNGGAFLIVSSRPTISNCTIADNTSKTFGGGLYVNAASMVTIEDSIIWDNKAEVGNEIYVTDSMNNIIFTNTCIDDSNNDRFDAASSMDFGMGGNLSSDPVFEPGSRGKYYLKHPSGKGHGNSSPCVDAGSKNAEALEYIADRTTSTQGFDDTGIVDMGYHYQK